MAELLAIEFDSPSGEPLLVEWLSERLERLDPSADGAGSAWRLGGEVDWDEVEALRVLSGRLGGGRVLAVAALRPAGASGHGEEITAGLLGSGDAFERLAEVLLSTEYGPDGNPRRVGLELYATSDSIAIRVAGDAIGPARESGAAVRRITVPLELRQGGEPGLGVLEVLTAR